MTSKLSYLHGYLGPRVRATIDGLPFTSEGYNRAKAILQDQYGKDAEVVKAYVKAVMELPTIPNVNVRKIHEFSERLTRSVQALQTMAKLESINGNVPMTLDKLGGIRGDLVRTDPDWQEWDFAKLSEAVRQWVRRNPITEKKEEEPYHMRKEKPRKLLHGKIEKQGRCVYCEGEHKTIACEIVTDISQRRGILAEKKLCFNCAAGQHRASSCASKSSCRNCQRRHHTSICDAAQPNVSTLLKIVDYGEGIFPVVVVKVNGIKCRALVDSGAGSSYASAKLIHLLNIKPSETRTARVDMLLESKVSRLEIYNAKLEDVDSDYSLEVKLTKIHKNELLFVDNPGYDQLIRKYPHLKDVRMNDAEINPQLPVHFVLGNGE